MKKNIILRFCLCSFESDTVKSDCPVLIFRKMMEYKDLKQTVGLPYLKVLLFFLEILKKALKMTSQFSELFLSPDPKSEKKFP